MPQFQPDWCAFGDTPGMGEWDNGHFREHQQFVQVLAAQTPAILIPAYDLMAFLTAADQRSAQNSHNSIHELLSQIVGQTAPDFTEYDLKDPDSFYDFTQYHSSVHAGIRQALGIT